jgi:hypothetical protein
MAKHVQRFRPGRAISNLGYSSFRLARRIAQSLSVFFLPIVVLALVVAAVTGHLNFIGDGSLAPGRENGLVKAPKPFRRDVIYYRSDLIDVIKESRTRGRDPLASFDVFKSACQDASTAWPYPIKPVELRFEAWGKEMHYAHTSQPTVHIDQENFAALLPLLRELQTLILEGGGAGRGELPTSHHLAEPVDREKWQNLERPEFDYL